MSRLNINKNLLEPKVVGIDQLRFDDRNTRTHDATNILAIKNSLEKFGQQKPVIVLSDGKIIAGNGTVQAAKELGWDSIAVVQFDSDDEKKAKAYAIADNRTAELAEWDMEQLELTLLEVKDEFPGEFFGFEEPQPTQQEVARGLYQTVFGETTLEHSVREGEEWRVGRHTLICASPISGVRKWKAHLSDDCIFAPFAGSLVTATKKAEHQRLVIVHPSELRCSQIASYHKRMFPEQTVERI